MKHLTIKTTEWQMSPEIQAHLDEKLLAIEKLLPDPDADTVRCDVELSHVGDKTGNEWRVEMNLLLGKELLRSEARAESMQAAIDIVKDEMHRQLERMKRRRSSLLKRGGARLKDLLRFGSK